jgi:hypothetical protein
MKLLPPCCYAPVLAYSSALMEEVMFSREEGSPGQQKKTQFYTGGGERESSK